MSQKRIVGYCCEHGALGAAERSREEGGPLSPEVQIIPVPCIGRVDVLHLLQAFREGADAVFVAGCLERNCHHLYGNFVAKKKVDQAKHILDALGLGGERLEAFTMASNQALDFETAIGIMIERVERLGTNPLGAQK